MKLPVAKDQPVPTKLQFLLIGWERMWKYSWALLPKMAKTLLTAFIWVLLKLSKRRQLSVFLQTNPARKSGIF